MRELTQGGWRNIAALLGLLGVLAAGSVPAAASETGESSEVATRFPRSGMLSAPQGGKPGNHFWTWSEGRRGYFSDAEGANLVDYDLDTLTVRQSVPLVPPMYLPMNPTSSAENLIDERSAVVDPAGRLFIATSSSHPDDSVVPAEKGVATAVGIAAAAADGRACANVATELVPNCLGGLSIYNAETLAHEAWIGLPSVRAEGGVLAAELLAMSYAPPRDEGDSAKVLMLVRDRANNPNPVGSVAATASVAMRASASITYAVQFDVDAKRHDWTVRVDACRGFRENTDEGLFPAWLALRDRAAIFRSPSLMDSAVFVACTANSSSLQAAVVKIPLDAGGAPALTPVTVADPAAAASERLNEPTAAPTVPVAPSQAQITVSGPDKAFQFIADPMSGRVLVRVLAGNPIAEVWWVFDAAAMQFVATIGIGAPVGNALKGIANTLAGLDLATGRFYLYATKFTYQGLSFPDGLFVADIRRNPVPQALYFPEFSDSVPAGFLALSPSNVSSPAPSFKLVVESRGAGRSPRFWLPNTAHRPSGRPWLGFWDRLPLTQNLPLTGYEGRTLDLEERPGVTDAALDGAARGYGFRTLLVGGVEAAGRAGPADPVGFVDQCNMQHWYGIPSWGIANSVTGDGVGDFPGLGLPTTGGVCDNWLNRHVPLGCTAGNRDVSFAFVGPEGPAVVDGAGSRGSAMPVVMDSATRADMEAPASRCSGEDWDEVWQTGLFGRAPLPEPQAETGDSTAISADCVSDSDEPQSSVGDPVTSRFAAAVACEEEETSGFSYVRGVEAAGVNVAESLSSFRIYRDPARGVVSRIDSVARGISVPPGIRIDTVRASAESWANGRAFTPPADEDGAYDPNCDLERTAGTCFQRHLFGVRTPAYGCGPCGDEQRLTDALTRALGTNGSVRLRQPDPALAHGADNGFTAAITKPYTERFADVVLNNDLLQTVLPGLEIIRQAPPNRLLSSGGSRGRQIYQFAGVEVSSSYGIACLLVYDEATNTCGEPAEAPGAITVSLSDPEGEPLAGGGFEVRHDVDADGVVGLADTLLPDGACVTAEDGIGTCVFDNLQPGTYLVSQVAAPPGYAKSAEPWVSEVASGERRTVAFTNVSDVSTIDLRVTDEADAPVSDATFAAYPDPDADGKVAPDAQPAATCTTDTEGVCAMRVPAGSYVLVQTGAPGGLEPIEAVAFTFASGGQVAAVSVVNYPPSQPAAPEGTTSPAVDYSPPVDSAPPVESIDDTYVPGNSVDEPAIAGPSVPEQIGGTVVRVIRAPGDALRLFARDPQQAVAFTAALVLLVLALLAVRRRQLLGGLTAMPAFAFTGGSPGGAPPATPPGAPSRPRGPSGGGGPSRGPSGAGPSGGSHSSGGSQPSRGGPVRGMEAEPAATGSVAATAVLDPPVVAGAAPPHAGPIVAVAAVTAFAPLASTVRERLAADARCELLAVVDSLEQLRALLAESRPDVLIIDLALSTGMSEDICDLLPGLHPPERTVGLILPRRSVDALITRGYKAGLGAMLDADEDLTNGQLAYAVRTVARGRVFYGPAVQSAMADRWPGQRQRSANVAGLTERELEVAKLAAAGMRRADIAQQLFLSPDTVKGKLRAIRAKLGVTNPWDHGLLRRRLEEIGIVAPDIDAPTDGGATDAS